MVTQKEIVLNLLQRLENVIPEILKLLNPKTEPHQVILDPILGLLLVTLTPDENRNALM
jgi:hypothetical protein